MSKQKDREVSEQKLGAESLFKLQAGDPDMVGKILHRFQDRLIRLAEQKLSRQRQFDPEDVVQSAFASVVADPAQAFQLVTSAQHVWNVLAQRITHKLVDMQRRAKSRKRGGGEVSGESAFLQSGADGCGIANYASINDDGFVDQLIREEYKELQNSLPDDDIRQVAEMLGQGATQDRIATELGISRRSVGRKIKIIEACWNQRNF